MLGCAWYLVDRGEGHLALLPMAILAVTALVSYERAKAESLGLSAKGGLMERAERMFLLGVAFLGAALFVPVLWILFALITATAVARFVKVWNAASGRDEVIRRRIEAWRDGRVDSRWRAWRESRASTGVPRRELRRELRTTSTTTGAPIGRWRARRQESPSSRSGRTARERRRAAAAARHANKSTSRWSSGRTTDRSTGRRANPPSPGSPA
jgi:hypothetical protein